MAESRLDLYREDILGLLAQGVSQAEVMRVLKERFGVGARRSTLSDYVKSLGGGANAVGMNGDAPPVAVLRPVADDPQAQAVMQGAGEEIVNRLADLIEGVTQLKREGEDTARRVQDTLERHSRAFDALHATFRGAVLARIWRRALLLSGVLWGGAIAALYLWRVGLPVALPKLW